MAFAQLTYRESLRDVEACLRAQPAKLYHLGLRGKVSRSASAWRAELWRRIIYSSCFPLASAKAVRSHHVRGAVSSAENCRRVIMRLVNFQIGDLSRLTSDQWTIFRSEFDIAQPRFHSRHWGPPGSLDVGFFTERGNPSVQTCKAPASAGALLRKGAIGLLRTCDQCRS